MSNVKTNYVDYALKPVGSGNPLSLRKFETYNATTGALVSTIYLKDVTDYATVGSNILASDLNKIGNAVNSNSTNFASEYSPSATYALGAYCTYQNVLYKCTTAITTPEAWNSAHWIAVNVMGEIAYLAYPVGSIYISNSSTSPASLFGGTWTQIAQGRTLIGQGTGYAVNATGGSETVSLTAEQNGPHAHSINEQYLHDGTNGDFANSHDGGSLNGFDYSPSSVNQGARRMTIPATSTNSSGSGSAHNNMMPYLVKYMWQRIA